MKYPVEFKDDGHGGLIAICPDPCPDNNRLCSQPSSAVHSDKKHWWGQHNSSCPNCKEISDWRHSRGISNTQQNTCVAPESVGPVSDEEVEVTVQQLQKLIGRLRS